MSAERIAIDDSSDIARLAALSPLQYERERKPAAQKLGIRVPILDRLVEAQRKSNPARGECALALPSHDPWHEPVDGAELLARISEAVRSHLVLEPWAADAVALWVLMTHALDAFAISPRLG